VGDYLSVLVTEARGCEFKASLSPIEKMKCQPDAEAQLNVSTRFLAGSKVIHYCVFNDAFS
jgi:hypothetical protein